jgi:hypothetical protein
MEDYWANAECAMQGMYCALSVDQNGFAIVLAGLNRFAVAPR